MNTTIEKAGEVIQQADAIKNKLQEKPADAEQLVMLETYLDDVKTNRKHDIQKEYQEVVNWLMLVYSYPIYFNVDDDDIKQIMQGHTLITSIDFQIDQAENRLKEERKTLEDQLITEKKNFAHELESISQQLEEFKTKEGNKNATSYRDQIKRIIAELQEDELKVKSINMQENFLGTGESEYPQVQRLLKQAGPFEELWSMRCAYQQIESDFSGKFILNFNPDQLDREFKELQNKSQSLSV